VTAYRFVTLTCDSCGEIFEPFQDEVSTRKTRREAADSGWQIRWGRDRRMQDWCGVCCGTHERIPGIGIARIGGTS
jgi:hypothetical protein